MKDNLHRLRKVCRYASNVLTVGYVVLAIVAVAMVALGIWAMADPTGAERLADLLGVPNAQTGTLAAACLESIVVFGVGSVIVFITEKIVKSIESEHSPFTQRNAERMMVMCYVFLATSVAMLVLEYLARGTATAVILFMGLLFVSVVVYALKLVFQYGAMLQEESDHTL